MGSLTKNKVIIITCVLSGAIFSLFSSTRELLAISKEPFLRVGDNDVGLIIRGNMTTTGFRQRSEMIPRFHVDQLFLDKHKDIDEENASTRCGRYGLKPYDGPPRRLFYGALIADDNWEILKIHAIETYEMYHTVVFVEANTSFLASPRQLRFKDSALGDLLIKSEMFGPNTKVYVDFWLENWPDLRGLNREAEQRNAIVKRWQQAGMTPNDVAIKADADEFFSRDFLRAVQTCDFPELRPDPSCHRPKIVPSTISFEMSPYCIKRKPWFHPDIISGHCVEGIGDPTDRVIPLRTFERKYGERDQSYGKSNLQNFPKAVHESGRYPLFSVADIRTVHGDRGAPYNLKIIPGFMQNAAYGVAYHFHNWFIDLKVLRNKYQTYSHSVEKSDSKSLTQIDGDLGIVVRCVKRIYDNENRSDLHVHFYREGWNVPGPKPIYFLNKTYLETRHKWVEQIVLEDEANLGFV